MSSGFLILGVVTAYLGISLGIGWILASRMSSSSDYFKGGGALPWWAAGLSQYMAGFSSYAFVVVAGVVYTKGAFGLLWCGLAPLVIFLGAVVFGPLWRRARIKTPVQYLTERFDASTRQLFSWIGILSRPLGNGVRLAAFGILITALLGWDRSDVIIAGLTLPMLIVIGGGIVVILYTALGGLLGAVVVDIVQCIILQAALIPLAILSINEVGGWGNLAESVSGGFSVMPPLDSSEWLWLLAWLLIFFADYNGGQWGLISRYASTRSERDARWAGVLSALVYIPLFMLIIIPVLAARVLFPDIHSESSFGWIAQHALPPGLVALVVAAMFSATLSTISAELNALAGVFTMDVIKGRWCTGASEASIVRIGRYATLGMGLVTLAIALLMLARAETIISVAQQLASFIVIPVALPLLFGLVIRKGNSKGVVCAIVVGIPSAWFGLKAGQLLGLPYNGVIFLQNFTAAGATIAALLVGSRIFQVSPAETERAGRFFRKMQTVSTPSTGDARFSVPLGLIGIAIVLNGFVLLLTILSPLNHDRPIPILLTALALLLLGLLFWYAGLRKPKTEPLS
jgi:solute:Na+ symporter, SSS family